MLITFKCIPREISSNWTALNIVDALIPIMCSDQQFSSSSLLVLDYRWFSLPNNSTLRLSNNFQYCSAWQYGKGTQLILRSGKKTANLTLKKDQITYTSSSKNHNITNITEVSGWQHFTFYINNSVKSPILKINGKEIDTIGRDLSIEVQNRTYWKIHRTKNYLYSDSKSFEFDKNKTCFYISAMYFCPNTTIIINNVSVNVNFSETNFWYTFELCDESKHVVFKVNIDLCNKFISYYIPDTYLLTDLPVFNDCFISTGKRQVTIYIYIGIILSLILLIVAVSIIYYLVKRKYDSEFKGMRVNNSDNEYDRIYMERIYLEIIN
ncbi:uncharacterized protein LOC109605601 isoform X7 [Aethina tumida]|uniref:uncharacterized protein LOC109605601 isoform X7 n=1 Tax=Aethina tumida TaxID=116153 RepID=UPI0021485B31|nr:uncharacterized protein LOC109605601 isoform X7 [Aethina tumida]